MRPPHPHFRNRLLVFSATVVALSVLHPGQLEAKEDDSMASALSKSGYRSVPLHRQSNGRLSVSVKVNGKPTQLAIVTGAPLSAIDRNSAPKLGIREQKTDEKISGAFGLLNQRPGIAPHNTIELLDIVQPDVTFTVFDEPMLAAGSKGSVAGFLGAPQLCRLAAIVDCGNARLYLRPNGESRQASTRLGELLAGRGFVRIPMQVNSKHHFEAACRLNKHSSAITIETFSTLTSVTKGTASAAGIASVNAPLTAQGAGGTTSPVKTGHVHEFSIGGVRISEPDIFVINSEFSVFGIDYLPKYSAVIDLGARNLYLRPRASSR